MKSLTLTLFLFLLLRVLEVHAKTIYVGISSASSEPYLITEIHNGQPKVVGGVLKELAEAILKEMGLSPTLVILPKKRVAPDLISGELSLICYAHESWYPGLQDKLLWTKPFTTNTNLIVTTSKKPLKKIEDLKGLQIGTVTNFVHKNLEPYFEKGLIHKEYAPDHESNIQKLVHGRIKYILISRLEYAYYKKKYPQLISHDLGIDTVEIKCAISPKAKLDVDRFNKAIDKLKKNGTLDKILRLTPEAPTIHGA